jgi:hypothetical protein
VTPGSAKWWAAKTRRFRTHLNAHIATSERSDLDLWTTSGQRALFDSMHIADRRHGLDVVAALRSEGVSDPEVLLAGLLHDAAKDRTGVWPRVAFSLGQAYGPWVWRLAGPLPGFALALERLRGHSAASAELAAAAGCSPRTVELIRWQETPRDPEYGELLRSADQAN